MEEDWKGELCCGISLNWIYAEGYVDISMSNYVHKQLTNYERPRPKKQHNCPYAPKPRKYGKLAQYITVEPDSPALNATGKKYVQQVVGSFLYYVQATDLTMLHLLNTFAAESSKPTERTMERVRQLLDYMYLNPNVIMCF